MFLAIFFLKLIPFYQFLSKHLKYLVGISNGLLFHLSFFLTNAISSSPKGEPCEEAFPDLFGDPNPIIVLQDIIVGLLDLEAFCYCFRNLFFIVTINF